MLLVINVGYLHTCHVEYLANICLHTKEKVQTTFYQTEAEEIFDSEQYQLYELNLLTDKSTDQIIVTVDIKEATFPKEPDNGAAPTTISFDDLKNKKIIKKDCFNQC